MGKSRRPSVKERAQAPGNNILRKIEQAAKDRERASR